MLDRNLIDGDVNNRFINSKPLLRYRSSGNSPDSAKSQDNGPAMCKQLSPSTLIYSRTRSAALLPDFPNPKDLTLPSHLDQVKVSTFLVMYRTHCQRILDTILRANFDEVQTFLMHFWQGVPPHLASLVESNAVVNLIGVCDSILYKTIANIMLPSVLQPMPDSLSKVMRQFAGELDGWLKMALFSLPEPLRAVKLEVARRFGRVLRRQLSLGHLAQASRMVVHNSEVTVQMVNDWRLVDIDALCRETLCDDQHNGEQIENQDVRTVTVEAIKSACHQFERFLEEEVQLEVYLEWLENLVQKCILQPSLQLKASMRKLSRRFLLHWSAFGSRIVREMTLHSASSFGSFHLLRLMFDDYVLYLVEYVHVEEQLRHFLRLASTDEPPTFTDIAFSDADFDLQANQTMNDYEPVTSTSEFPTVGPEEGPDQGDGRHQMTFGQVSESQSYGYLNGQFNQSANQFYPIDQQSSGRVNHNYSSQSQTWYPPEFAPPVETSYSNSISDHQMESTSSANPYQGQYSVDTTTTSGHSPVNFNGQQTYDRQV